MFPGYGTASPVLQLFFLFLLLFGLTGIQSAQAQHHALTNVWSVAPGAPTHTFMISDDRTRGSAYNPVTGHFIVASRYPASPATTNVYILDGTTGSVLGTLPWDASIITSGNFAVNMVGITTDGVIYVGNLTTDATGGTGPFRLYRWANETAQPTLAYSGDPSAGNTIGTSPRPATSGVTAIVNCDGASGRLCAGCSGGSTPNGEPIRAECLPLASPST